MVSDAELLRQVVDRLTKETTCRVKGAYGGRRYVKVAPLLVQLRLEIGNASNTGGGASKTTAAIPLAAAALDLLVKIRAEVHERWWLTHHLHHGHGRGTLVGELRAWASVAQAAGGLEEAVSLCGAWAAAITALLQPVRRWEIRAACPACKATRTVASLDVGETVYAPALAIEFLPGGARGVCRACGADFDPQVLARLLGSV